MTARPGVPPGERTGPRQRAGTVERGRANGLGVIVVDRPDEDDRLVFLGDVGDVVRRG